MNDNHKPRPDILDQATGALHDAPTAAGPPAELVAATVAAVHNRLAGAVPSEQTRLERRRRIMRYVSFGSATAAVVAIALVLWSPGRSSAGMFERAMENAEKAGSVRFKITTTAGEMKFEMKMYGLRDRFRTEMDMGKEMGGFVILVDGTQKKGLQLMTGPKTAKWLDLEKPDEKQGAVAKDAAGVAKLFADLKGKDVKQLPDETIDGRKLKVFAVKGHKLAGSKGEADITMWIDPKTELPARCRTEMTIGDVKAVAVTEALGWNEELDEKLFEMKVPEGYTVEKPKEKEKEPASEPTVYIRFIQPVVDQARKADSVVYTRTDTHLKKGAPPQAHVTTEYGSGGAARAEGANGEITWAQETRLAVFHGNKTYSIERVPGRPESAGDILAHFLSAKDQNATALGDEVLGGVTTKKYEAKSGKPGEDGAATATLWVDPKTGFPVKMHVVLADGTQTTTFEKFRWNEKLDPKLFSLVPPQGYKRIEN